MMKISSEDGSDCNTALVRKINKLFDYSLKHSCSHICAFCNTFSSVATSFCFTWKFEVIGAYWATLLVMKYAVK